MQTLSKREKLLDSLEFQRVYRLGRRVFTRGFTLFFLPNSKKVLRRLGITVTKEIGKANERNRIKRQVREVFRLNKGLLPSGDIVVKALRAAADTENKDLRKSLLEGFGRCNKDRSK